MQHLEEYHHQQLYFLKQSKSKKKHVEFFKSKILFQTSVGVGISIQQIRLIVL